MKISNKNVQKEYVEFEFNNAKYRRNKLCYQKKAIKLLKTYENKLVYEIEDKDKKAVKLILNLITKLQKENETLKEKIKEKIK